MTDEQIITNAMLRAQDQERIELLEGLLKAAMGALMGDFEVNPHDVLKRIRAALGEG